ncbi:uncharacterized protein H6S33_007503 [Morchella sextelata]|uniref:uncharacterized protein n=1 Tax=Morchella sextelata TaxID=1174677 RepID=UPI001D0425F5|nr:uncharacterized protein H6S33_007503 [Morchella sextelata]KAH0603844.1 hypothetical protein H6S33_007503 [Morchella sextelata]
MPNIVSGGSRKLVASLKLLWKGSVPPPVWQTTMTAAISARTASALTPQATQPPENLRRIDFATEVSIRSPILTLGTNFGWRMIKYLCFELKSLRPMPNGNGTAIAGRRLGED